MIVSGTSLFSLGFVRSPLGTRTLFLLLTSLISRCLAPFPSFPYPSRFLKIGS